MALRWRNQTYLKVRRWVDRDISVYPRQSIALLGAFLAMMISLLGASALGPLATLGFWILILPIWSAWTVFVVWRLFRITRALSMKGDRGYDQKTKFSLPPQYADSESVLAASRRGRRSRRR